MGGSEQTEVEVAVDEIINCIERGVRDNNKSCMTQAVSSDSIHRLCCAAREIMQAEGSTVEVAAPINILGDVHGQLPDLMRMLDKTRGLPTESFLFLGDYVDRGKWSLETITLLLAYKVKYPKQIYLLRGNHECASVNRIYGFYDDCKRKYSIKVWKTFTGMFSWMPLAAVVGGRIFCVHGGLSPELQSIHSINDVSRPVDTAGDQVISDILWSDPDNDITGWGENDRGVGTTFGPDVVRSFLEATGYELVCRAHQVVEDGYEFFAGRRLVTIFSAPNYCGQFDNAAAMLRVGSDLLCRMDVLKPQALS